MIWLKLSLMRLESGHARLSRKLHLGNGSKQQNRHLQNGNFVPRKGSWWGRKTFKRLHLSAYYQKTGSLRDFVKLKIWIFYAPKRRKMCVDAAEISQWKKRIWILCRFKRQKMYIGVPKSFPLQTQPGYFCCVTGWKIHRNNTDYLQNFCTGYELQGQNTCLIPEKMLPRKIVSLWD